jgi:predicted AlkP superfamily pyrophosphatase or phosphodiesterase
LPLVTRNHLRALLPFVGALVLSHGAHAQSVATNAPTLVVFLVIDQMRPDYLPRYERQLTGGLKRLYDQGAVFLNGYQDHAITETAPGHASTMSGRFPSSTGIVYNAAGVEDPLAPMIGGGGPGASPFRFRGSTLTDWIRLATPKSRALSVSRKDRGAILPIGRQPEEVYWYASDGRFTTSTYYHDTLPSWVQQFNARRIPETYAGKQWTLLLPAKEYAEPDSADFENAGRNFTFPHAFPTSPADAARALLAYPAMDSLTLQFALHGLQAMELGKGPTTDVLCVSLSTTDAVGHAYGPDSREIHDQVLRLDRYLGIFFDSLFKLRDANHVVVALTADHAVQPNPIAHAKAVGGTPRYVDLEPTITHTAEQLAARGADPNAFRVVEGMVIADRDLLARAHVDADSLLRVFEQDVKRVSGVRVDRVRDLLTHDTATDYVARRWIHMIPPDIPVDLVITLEPYAYWEGSIPATHGTPNDLDARVPVIFYGTMIKPGRFSDTVRVVDMAPTLAKIVHVRPTERLDGHVLTQILR